MERDTYIFKYTHPQSNMPVIQGEGPKVRIASEYVYRGEEGTAVWRYCAGEPELDKKKQPEWAKRSSVWIDRSGILLVDKAQTELLKFLRHHPNPNLQEVVPEKRAEKVSKELQHLSNVRMEVFKLDYVKQVRPLLRLIGESVTDNEATDRVVLFSYAEDNPNSFEELLQSRLTDRVHTIQNAEGKGIIVFKAQGVHWGAGGLITGLPPTYSDYKAFAEWTYGPEGREAWNIILSRIDSFSPAKEAIESFQESVSDEKTERLLSLDAEDLFDIAKSKKLVLKEQNTYICQGVKGKGKILEHIEQNKKEFVSNLL